MLGVFQEVVVGIKGHNLGDLPTFDLMFEGIRTALKSGIQESIARAEKTISNKFALRVLKAMFLVKYVKEFKPTLRNICVLMQDNFKTSSTGLKKDVEEALALLESQTLIQSNGDLYEYLTDEEHDVELDIKSTEIDVQSVQAELEKLVFDGVIKNRKIRWDESGQDYHYTRKLDDNQKGREYELTINVISSFNDHRGAVDKHKTDTVYNDELRVVMPESERLLRTLKLYKQTEKYISLETRNTQQDTVNRILADKAGQNGERYNQLKMLVSNLMGEAVFFVAGQEIEFAGEDGQSKVQKAFIELTKKTYPHLNMLRGKQYKESEIATILTQGSQGLFGDETSLPEAEQELLSHIQSNHRGGVRSTVKMLLDKFEKKPYGWSYASVLCVAAQLCARGKMEVRESTNLLDDSELAKALINSNTHGNLILDPQVEFTPGQTKKLKGFFNDYFDKVAHSTEAKALAREAQGAFNEQKIELEDLQRQADRYPFLRALTGIIDELAELESKPYPWFVTELCRDEDKWLDNYKDGVIEPIIGFMRGSNKTQLDAANQLLNEHKVNLSYVQADELDAINSAVVDPNIHKGGAIKRLMNNMQSLKAKLDKAINDEKMAALTKIEILEHKLSQYDGYISLDETRRAEVQGDLAGVKRNVNDQTLIAMIRDSANNFESYQYDELLQKIEAWNKPDKPNVTPVDDGSGAANESPDSPYQPKAKVEIVRAADLSVTFEKIYLDSETDVGDYLEIYKATLLDAVKQGKKVRV